MQAGSRERRGRNAVVEVIQESVANGQELKEDRSSMMMMAKKGWGGIAHVPSSQSNLRGGIRSDWSQFMVNWPVAC